MKKFSKIKFPIFILIFCFLFGSQVLAIEPLKDERPPGVPPDVEPQEKEFLEGAKEIIKKETKLTIERIHPAQAKIDEIVEIILKIKNLGKEKVEFFVTETHKPNLEYIDPIEIKWFKYQGLQVPYYQWKLTLETKKETEIKYHIKPKSLGMILFSPAIINDEYGNNFESVPTTLEITCNPNGKCDEGENYIFCSKDCPTGSSDSICDGAEDGRCDPDCKKEADSDCLKIKKKTVLNLYYIVVGIVIIACLILILKFFKKRKFKKKYKSDFQEKL